MSLQEPSAQDALALLEAGDAEAALGTARAALVRDGTQPMAWMALGRAAQALGSFENAANAYRALDRLRPGRPAILLAQAQCLAEADRLGEAEAVLRRALALGGNAAAHANLGAVLARLERVEESCLHLRAALALEPGLVAAHGNLAALLADADPAAARHHRDAAYRGRAVCVRETVRPRRRVLALCAAAGGNVPLRHLLPASENTVVEWFVDYATPSEAPPACDAVFNAMGDADIAPALPGCVRDWLRAHGRRLLNSPEAVARTRRDRLKRLLAGIDGVVVPWVMRRGPGSARAVPAGPLIVRPLASHGGRGVRLVERAEELPETDAYVTQFVDYASADGWFRKYRAIIVAGEAFPYHLAISRHWLVHYWTAGMEADPQRRDEERRFLADPARVLGEGAWRAVTTIGRRLGLDYAGVDFSLLPDGRVLVFEANATMLIHPEYLPIFAYRNETVARIRTAFADLLDLAAIPAGRRAGSGPEPGAPTPPAGLPRRIPRPVTVSARPGG